MLDTSIVSKPKVVEKDGSLAVFEIENLYAGYGITLGNALRRVLLSSLPGAAITQVKINGVEHEFSTIKGVSEDVIEIMLNLKKVRFRMHTDEPQTLLLNVKGEKKVSAKDIEDNQNVEVINGDLHIATISDKKTSLEMELKVERGLGYEPVEMRKKEKLPIGTIALDAFFSPVKKVNFSSENMRVGDRTDYNRLRIVIETDGSMTPEDALYRASDTLVKHFETMAGVGGEKADKKIKEDEGADDAEEEKEVSKSKSKTTKKSSSSTKKKSSTKSKK